MEHKCWYLQLFAEGISGDTGSADAGQGNAGASPVRANDTQAAAAENTRLSWAQIMADPEYNRQMQATIRARLKAAEQAWEKKNVGRGLAPTAQHTPAMTAGESPHPTGPVEGRGPSGRPVPTGPVEGREVALRQHYDGLVQQGEQLRRVFPDFDLQRELRDPAFTRLTAPHVGVSVADAYYLLHRQEHQGAAMRLAAKKTAEKLSNAIRSGSHRPAENGTGSQAPVVTGFNYANASLQQREALKDAIRRAGSRGEKLYPTGNVGF